MYNIFFTDLNLRIFISVFVILYQEIFRWDEEAVEVQLCRILLDIDWPRTASNQQGDKTFYDEST